MNATRAQILALQFSYTPAEIEAAGYTKMVAQARTWASGQISKAAKTLKDLPIPANSELQVSAVVQHN